MGSVVDDSDSVDTSATAAVAKVDGESKAQVNSKSTKRSNGGLDAIESTYRTSPPVISTANTTGNTANTAHPSRRNFTSEFKQQVFDAYNSDPDCIGNQRATARKFNIHRRQVQKWLTQLDKESDHSQSSPDHCVNPEDGSASNNWIHNNSPSSTSSSSDKEFESQDHQPPVDLCNMSSAAMAMSLNLTQTPTSSSVIVPNTLGYLKLPYSDRSRNNSSTQEQQQGMPSPNSILSKFYSLYAAPLHTREHFGNEVASGKYRGHNGDSPPNLVAGALQKNKCRPSASFTTQQQLPPRNNRQRQHSKQNGYRSQHMRILDEIAAAHPHEDFSLLRQALIRNDVSFTKVPSSAPKSTFFPVVEPNPERHNGKSRTSSPTSPQQNLQNQTLTQELNRQQNEYLRLLQQSALNLSPEGPTGSNHELTSKYPWLLAQAAATLGLPLTNTPPSLNGKKESPPHHVFVSPKPPGSKPKTVAAALAATRSSPNYRQPSAAPTSSNKRKNSKPNQICDFQVDLEDDDLDGFDDVPLDMMIPLIKKRRVSS